MAQPLHEQVPALEQRLAKEPQSPLFARLASHYLQAGRSQDALRLCDEGLAHYPFYSTGHLIKGKVLLELQMLAEAKREFEVVLQLLPTNELASQLYSSIDLGPAADLSAPAAVEEPPAAAEAELPITEAAPQEIAPEETTTVSEQADFQAEAAPALEPGVEETPMIQEETPAFAAEAPPAEEVSPFGVETPTAEFQEPARPESADFGFGGGVEAPPATEPTTDAFGASLEEQPGVSTEFGVQPTEQVSPDEVAPAEPTQVSTATEAPAPEPTTPFDETKSAEAPPTEEGKVADWFEAFSQLQGAPTEAAEPTVETPAEEENPFAMFGAEPEAAPTEAPVEGEAYDEFAARKRMELFGTEDSLTLEEYLASPSSAEPTAPPEGIEQLAEKLKTPTKIAPVINYAEKAPRPASEADTPASSGFVTPTLAEIYVKQGWYDDAIKAYRALAANKPAEREKFEQRIAEIERMKEEQK